MESFEFELLSTELYVMFAFALALNTIFCLFVFQFTGTQDDSAQVQNAIIIFTLALHHDRVGRFIELATMSRA